MQRGIENMGVVVITGGSAGIGRAAARMFAERGNAIGLIARGQDRLDAARDELARTGTRVHTVSADVADADAVEAAASEIESALGPITTWVNNAMATIYAPIAVAEEAEIRRVMEVTFLGAVHGTKAALRRMRERGGTIVQVSSILAWRAAPIQGAYCSAKFALRGFTESLRSELIHDRSPVRLTMVHLPAINTPQYGWARNRTQRVAKAPDPVYTPATAAHAILLAADTARRDIWVGRATPATIVASRLAPGVIDHVLARKGYDSQLGASRDEAMTEGNLFAPVPGTQAAEGTDGARARDGRREIVTSREADGVAAGMLVLGLIGLASLVPSALLPRACRRLF